MCSYWLRTWRHTCTRHLHTPFAYAIITKTSYAFFAKITLCIFYPVTPFAHAFACAIKKTPYAFFAKITLCMYILCDYSTDARKNEIYLLNKRYICYLPDERSVLEKYFVEVSRPRQNIFETETKYF